MLATAIKSALLLIATGLLAARVSPAEEAPMPPRQILLEKMADLPANPINARVIRVSFPRGFKTPLHTHEGPGPRYVVKGKVRIDEGGQINTYGPGEVFWESGQWMSAENVGDEEAVMIIFELAKPKASAP
ncbi:MAG: cupin domain-containing protein [Gammaproteobacteria bacterium]|nr:cupin domain-containing protein [Gammaproteobacteria bacterium]